MISADAVRDGLAQGEFFLEYLPTVSLADGMCKGAEALTRWRRDSKVLQPDEFIHIVEGTHLSGMLTYWVLETVAKELGDWLRIHKEVNIEVNVPPELLGRGGLEYVATKTGLAEIRNQIVLEVTERGVPDSLGVAAIEAASRSGVRIALDDVTLTAANLVVLSRCTFDVIKTDRSLVDQITTECPSPAWLSGLSALLHSTRAAVIAEGVETEAQANALRAAGISMAQGYYFSRPISAEQLKVYYSTAGSRSGKASGYS
jgi:EAL domain-containing protein (putative c-di-GMP-specific phosphodiesterase class I)